MFRHSQRGPAMQIIRMLQAESVVLITVFVLLTGFIALERRETHLRMFPFNQLEQQF